MSKYWDPAWAKPSTVETLFRPGAASLEQLAASFRPHGWEDAPKPEPCLKGERSVIATFGPDFVLLVPAAHRVAAGSLQKEVGRLTYYFICTRPRIRARHCTISARMLTFRFDVFHDDGTVAKLDKSIALPANVRSTAIVDNGAAIEYELEDGIAKHEAALTAQALFNDGVYQPSFLDLEVRYIGRARGVLAEQCALDRLESHEKYQAVMEEVLASPQRNRDVWLVLGAGTNMDVFGMIDEAAKQPSEAEAAAVDHRVRSTLFTPRRIDVTEALLINYFKPPLNEHHVRELNLKSRTFKHCYDAGLTHLQLVLPTTELRIALYTDHVDRSLWNVMTVCLHDD